MEAEKILEELKTWLKDKHKEMLVDYDWFFKAKRWNTVDEMRGSLYVFELVLEKIKGLENEKES